jgi:hypothetical protein
MIKFNKKTPLEIIKLEENQKLKKKNIMASKKEHNHIRLGLSQNNLACGLEGG